MTVALKGLLMFSSISFIYQSQEQNDSVNILFPSNHTIYESSLVYNSDLHSEHLHNKDGFVSAYSAVHNNKKKVYTKGQRICVRVRIQ